MGLALLPKSSGAQSALGYFPIPTRAFVVEGGSIGLQAGVMRNREVQAGSAGESRHPTKYFLIVRNETDAIVMVTVEWQFPGEDWKRGGASPIERGKDLAFWQNKLGVIADTNINVRVTVYAARTPLTQIGSEETFLLFTSAEREEFLAANFSEGRNSMMTGWPEMGRPATNIPGTLADAELQTDIQLLLWKEESKQHRSCKHEAQRVEPAPLDSSAIIAGMLAEGGKAAKVAQRVVQRARDTAQQAAVRLERWTMGSCGVATTYEVLEMPSRGGGTDIIVRRAAEDTTTRRP